MDRGLRQIFEPESAKAEEFLTQLAALEPHLCVTVAYGNFLPSRFLGIPQFGTLNIHPSLLPQFRGAAPVPRALEQGLLRSGVTVAFTVLAMDAGPVVRQVETDIDPDEQAPELLARLMRLGTEQLLRELPGVWTGEAARGANPQNETSPPGVSHAAKMEKSDGVLDFASTPGSELHNKVRAYAGWPGTSATLVQIVEGGAQKEEEEVPLKVIRTTAAFGFRGITLGPPTHGSNLYPVEMGKDALVVPCQGGSSTLHITEVQVPGKKVMTAQAFANGIKSKKAKLFVKC